MIIVGFSTKETTKPAGEHTCPVCGQTRSFVELRNSRRFTLFFIPILPLGSKSLGRVVCTSCSSQFPEEQITGV